MNLLTQAQRAQLIENGRRQAAVRGTDAEIDFKPVVKLFDTCGVAVWLLTEIEPEDSDIAWGLCDLGFGCPELGTVSLSKLAAFKGGLRIECDLTFEADKPISTYADKAMQDSRIFV